MISIDTLGAKHLGVYGYPRDTSERMDRIARDNILFENAYATAPVTAPSHMSMFTSLWPSVHGVSNISFDRDNPESQAEPLRDDIVTLAELLHARGYETVGITGGGNVTRALGFDRGFDSYRHIEYLEDTVEQSLEFLRSADETEFFLFVHTFHVHDPYRPEPPYDTKFDPDYSGDITTRWSELAEDLPEDPHFRQIRQAYWSRVDKSDPADREHLVALYDGSICEVDRAVGRLFEAIREHAPNTLVFITSDHGEEFAEHGGWLHEELYEETLRVPLILAHPKMEAPLRVPTRVSLMGLSPTILDLLSVPVPAQFQGRSWRPLLRGGAGDRSIFAETTNRTKQAFVANDLKLVDVPEGVELYDLLQDPAEQEDLATQRPEAVRRLQRRVRLLTARNDRLLVRWRRDGGSPSRGEPLEPETLDRLKALGYVE